MWFYWWLCWWGFTFASAASDAFAEMGCEWLQTVQRRVFRWDGFLSPPNCPFPSPSMPGDILVLAKGSRHALTKSRAWRHWTAVSQCVRSKNVTVFLLHFSFKGLAHCADRRFNHVYLAMIGAGKGFSFDRKESWGPSSCSAQRNSKQFEL